MRILITGANGQLGKELTREAKQVSEVTAVGKEKLDITNVSEVKEIVNNIKPDIIVHSAAYTAVDNCENEKKKAFEVNSLGTLNVTKAADQVGASIVYLSSDYIFSGEKTTPYIERDEPNPKNIYGMSKWLGEQLIQSSTSKFHIVRTSWLFGSGGENFVKTILKLAKQNKEIKVVNDQVGSPTYTKDLAGVIMQLIYKKFGIYHVSNMGCCTWYMFAKHILKQAGYDPGLIQPTTTQEYGARATRPAYSALGHESLQREGIPDPRGWQEAVNEFIREELNRD
ncbi:dTDP-4-dehydrorhamnose reductase [Alkalihalobacterium sp. APHAB7]|uniref:dTDP-4-dehydrorhamnose reductase n=1 Tax=Alkalihalobacterium sp. APHAB7 TaxID=3402081 RepID=UPI003AAEE914